MGGRLDSMSQLHGIMYTLYATVVAQLKKMAFNCVEQAVSLYFALP